MTGYRVLAIIIGLLLLATAVGMFFHRQPCVVKITGWLWQSNELKTFVKSAVERDLVVKQYMKYLVYMGSVVMLGTGLMFIVSAFSPLRMRPFIVVVIITLILGVAMDIFSGITLKRLSPYWWGVDAGTGMLLIILLIAFFPKKTRKPVPTQQEEEAELVE